MHYVVPHLTYRVQAPSRLQRTNAGAACVILWWVRAARPVGVSFEPAPSGIIVRRFLALCSVCAVALLTVVLAQAGEKVSVGVFSDLEPGDLPAGWEPLRFPSIDEDTDYVLWEEEGRVVLRADSRRSASALVRKVEVDVVRFPYLNWSWKTGENCFTGNWRRPEDDDFPLRLFVLFEGRGRFLSFFRRLGSAFPGDAILYLTESAPVEGEASSSHLSDRIKVVPLSWPREPGLTWDRRVRNVRSDYVALFGKNPGRVAAVAVMTDTDNSATECVSHFGDIYFSESPPP